MAVNWDAISCSDWNVSTGIADCEQDWWRICDDERNEYDVGDVYADHRNV